MIKTALASGLVLLLAAGFIAAEGPTFGSTTEFTRQEIESIVESRASVQIGSLTFKETQEIAERLSVAWQKDLHVRDSYRMSFIFPGAGQFQNEDRGNGALFFGANLAITVGTALAAFYLLPEDLSSHIDYYADDFSDIRRAWLNHGFEDYMPSIGALIGGTILSVIVRVISADHARDLARERIRSGAVTFEPFAPERFWSMEQHGLFTPPRM